MTKVLHNTNDAQSKSHLTLYADRKLYITVSKHGSFKSNRTAAMYIGYVNNI